LIDRGVLVMGYFQIVRKRDLVRWLKGCDVSLYRDLRRIGAKASVALLGGADTDQDALKRWQQQHERELRVVEEEELLHLLRIEWSIDQRLSELRSLLHQPASEATWDAICQELELWPNDGSIDIAARYIQDQTSSWSESITQRPLKRWVKRALAGQPDGRLQIARDLLLSWQSIPNAASATRLLDLASPELRGIHLSTKRLAADEALPPSWTYSEAFLDSKALRAMLDHPKVHTDTFIDLRGLRVQNYHLTVLNRRRRAPRVIYQ
jgi:hypothetical protein